MIGEKLGKYTIIENVGSGSMGTVYKAENPDDGLLVAIKLVRANVLYNIGMRERFLQGLLTLTAVRHTGILPILEIGDDEDDFFVITPFLRGHTLSQLLHGQPLDWRFAASVTASVCEAIAAVHAAGGVHRALKPSNIWLQPDGGIVLTDCSVARFTEIEGESRPCHTDIRNGSADTIIPMGALAYMSPEQVSGEMVDYRTDIFSLGVVLYEMLAGRHPFEARNSPSRMSAILEAEPLSLTSRKLALPQAFDGILKRALAKKAAERYQDVNELLNDLRGIGEAGPPVASEAAAPGSLSRGGRTAARFWVPAIIVILSLTAAAYYFLAP